MKIKNFIIFTLLFVSNSVFSQESLSGNWFDLLDTIGIAKFNVVEMDSFDMSNFNYEEKKCNIEIARNLFDTSKDVIRGIDSSYLSIEKDSSKYHYRFYKLKRPKNNKFETLVLVDAYCYLLTVTMDYKLINFICLEESSFNGYENECVNNKLTNRYASWNWTESEIKNNTTVIKRNGYTRKNLNSGKEDVSSTTEIFVIDENGIIKKKQ